MKSNEKLEYATNKSNGPVFTTGFSDDVISETINELFTGNNPFSHVIHVLFNNKKIIYKEVPQWKRIFPGTHAIGGSYVPGTLCLHPYLYHHIDSADLSNEQQEEIKRLTISKLMQEYSHILQEQLYKKHGYYMRYIIDLVRCHLEPLLLGQQSAANLKSSYKNTRYFEGEAHQAGEPEGHLIFLATYIAQHTSEKVEQHTLGVDFFLPETHPSIQGKEAYHIAQLCNDYFDEFYGREEITINQYMTRSTHLSDYIIASKRLQRAKEQDDMYTLVIPKRDNHPHGINIQTLLES